MPASTRASSQALPPAFQRLAWANLAAQAAEQISLAAVPIVAVLLLQAGPQEIGLLNALQALPFLLLSIPLGVWADRSSRRQVMLVGESLRVLALLGLLLMLALHQVHLLGLGLLGFVGATGTVAFMVAAPAWVPRVVPRDALAQANGRLELVRSMAFAGGPALAGAVVGAAGGGVAFAVAAALAAMAVAFLFSLPRDEAATANLAARHPLQELAEGLRFVWQHELLKPMVLCGVVWNISWFVMHAAYVPHAMTRLGLGSQGVGLTLALYGIGMVIGAVIAPRLMQRVALGPVILIGPLVSVFAAAIMAASAWWPWPGLAALSLFLFGVGPIMWTVSTTTLRQAVTPNDRMGRVGALTLTANAGARPLGALLGAGVGTVLDDGAATTACLVLAALGYALQAVLIMASKVPRLRALPSSS
jgi:predicted MFS family arabinose efflux permease